MSRFLKNPFGIRFKLVFMSSFLLVIPWLGYQYILEMILLFLFLDIQVF